MTLDEFSNRLAELRGIVGGNVDVTRCIGDGLFVVYSVEIQNV